MRAPIASDAGTGSGAGLAPSGILIVLILLLGAIAFLRYARYLRGRTAYTLGVIVGLAIIALAYAMYARAY
jgi:hypothetical protein